MSEGVSVGEFVFEGGEREGVRIACSCPRNVSRDALAPHEHELEHGHGLAHALAGRRRDKS